MVRKSENEVALIRESARWCEHAHRLLQEYTRPGATEAEASLRAGHEATLAMLEALGDVRRAAGSADGVSAGYRGQIGLRSSWAHAVAHNIEFQAGDVLVTETSAPIWGYNAELERAMIIGHADRRDAPPLRPHRRGAAGRLRRVAARRHLRRHRRRRDALLRGATTCCRYWRQHTGHAIGLRNHEAPFLDLGDHTPIEPGMVFTIEPGLYAARRRRVPPLRHRRRHARRRSTSSRTTRATSRA